MEAILLRTILQYQEDDREDAYLHNPALSWHATVAYRVF
jgi:hypothetical protein